MNDYENNHSSHEKNACPFCGSKSIKIIIEKEYMFSLDAERKIRNHLIWLKSVMTPKNFSNGRYIRNMIEKAIRVQAMRLLLDNSYERNELQLLKASDFEFEEDK